MKVSTYLSIGFPAAVHRDELEIDDEDLEGLSDNEREEVINQIVREWADNYIEYNWFEL